MKPQESSRTGPKDVSIGTVGGTESKSLGDDIPYHGGENIPSYTYGDPVPRAVGIPKIRWYAGVCGSGKTYLALMHAMEDSKANGNPILIVNSANVDDFDAFKFPRAKTLAEAVAAVWRDKKSVQYVPKNGDEVDSIIRATMEPGRVNLLIDEMHLWLSSKSHEDDDSAIVLCRTYRHSRASVYLTTQHFSADIPQPMVSCAPEFYIFRCTAPAVLDRLERGHGLPREEVRALPARRFFRHYEGF